MKDSAGKATSILEYEVPELEIHQLAAIVMSGATGGGDTGSRTIEENIFGSRDGEEKDSCDPYCDW